MIMLIRPANRTDSSRGELGAVRNPVSEIRFAPVDFAKKRAEIYAKT